MFGCLQFQIKQTAHEVKMQFGFKTGSQQKSNGERSKNFNARNETETTGNDSSRRERKRSKGDNDGEKSNRDENEGKKNKKKITRKIELQELRRDPRIAHRNVSNYYLCRMS